MNLERAHRNTAWRSDGTLMLCWCAAKANEGPLCVLETIPAESAHLYSQEWRTRGCSHKHSACGGVVFEVICAGRSHSAPVLHEAWVLTCHACGGKPDLETKLLTARPATEDEIIASKWLRMGGGIK